MYTIESNCDMSNDIDKQTDNISDDNDVITNFLNVPDPLDVQSWPLEDSLSQHHDDLPPSYPFEDLNTSDDITDHFQQNEMKQEETI